VGQSIPFRNHDPYLIGAVHREKVGDSWYETKVDTNRTDHEHPAFAIDAQQGRRHDLQQIGAWRHRLDKFRKINPDQSRIRDNQDAQPAFTSQPVDCMRDRADGAVGPHLLSRISDRLNRRASGVEQNPRLSVEPSNASLEHCTIGSMKNSRHFKSGDLAAQDAVFTNDVETKRGQRRLKRRRAFGVRQRRRDRLWLDPSHRRALRLPHHTLRRENRRPAGVDSAMMFDHEVDRSGIRAINPDEDATKGRQVVAHRNDPGMIATYCRDTKRRHRHVERGRIYFKTLTQ
jgi:ketosteroid isomerase-like protein